MSYKAIIKDASNILVTSTSASMQICILQGSASGTPVYKEKQNVITDANDLVIIEMGASMTTDDFSAIDPEGMYVYEIFSNNNQFENGKLIINR